jgi:hypothetical protein
MTLKLEDGKTYVDGHGEKIHITRPLDSVKQSFFRGSDGWSYAEDGSAFGDGPDLCDLVSEVKEDEPMNPYLTSMFKNVPATRKFVGMSTLTFSITQDKYPRKVFVDATNYFNTAELKDLILALEAAVSYLENKE